MARIRSIHPALFTDEAFMALSSDAQIFFLGLWTESDDQGIFAWKPLTLKVRLRGGKDGSVEALLGELIAVNSVQKYELEGRQYGAIRNFRRFQRPKKPNSIHPITDEIRTFVALIEGGAEPGGDKGCEVPHQFGTSGEKSPQMEEVGGRREDVCSVEAKASPGADGAGKVLVLPADGPPAWWPTVDRYDRVTSEVTDKTVYDVAGKILGAKAGGQVTRLRKCKRYSAIEILELLLLADKKSNPKQWFAAIVNNAEKDQFEITPTEKFPAHSY